MNRLRIPITIPVIAALTSVLSAHSGEVVRTLPAPGGFCTGAAFDGECLWVADHKQDRLSRIDVASGEVVGSIPSPGYWPTGLAWDGEHLWNADDAQKRLFQVVVSDGTVLRSIDSPTSRPDGLAWDGSTLWVGDYKNGKIMRIDLSDGTAVKTLPAPARAANGLAFDGTYLWCADRMMDEIYMIDPESGDVLMVLDSPGPFPRGLAWDGECLWNVDYQHDRVYRLVRQDDELYRLTDTRRARVTHTHEVAFHGQGRLRMLEVCFAMPEEMPQQRVLSTTLSPEGHGFAEDRWNQRVAVFGYSDHAPGPRVRTTLEVEAQISAIRYFVFPDRCGSLDDIPYEIRERYTADGSKYQMSDPYIQDLARKVVGEETNPYYIARRVFDHVRGALEYKLEGGWNAAPVVLQRGTGSCSEYSFCFIALCRAAGLPARYVGALVVRGDDASLDDTFHRWPEVYLPSYGWIPIDPQAGDKSSPRDRALAIGDLSNRFLITTQGGGDSRYLGWYYNSHESYVTDPKVEVHVETFAEWEPLDEG